MNPLADTHVLLWPLDDPGRISATARDALSDAGSGLFASLVSVREVRVGQAAGELRLGIDPVSAADGLRAEPLGIGPTHVERVRDLPPRHEDPFDRLLVAQALAEPMTLVAADRNLWRRPVLRLW